MFSSYSNPRTYPFLRLNQFLQIIRPFEANSYQNPFHNQFYRKLLTRIQNTLDTVLKNSGNWFLKRKFWSKKYRKRVTVSSTASIMKRRRETTRVFCLWARERPKDLEELLSRRLDSTMISLISEEAKSGSRWEQWTATLKAFSRARWTTSWTLQGVLRIGYRIVEDYMTSLWSIRNSARLEFCS